MKNKFELKELHIENFRSWKKLGLKKIDKLGMVLVHGNNGTGKSSIRQAIEYLLTDRVSDSIPLDEFTYNNEGNCVLSCVIKHGKDVITITKYREHSDNGNTTILDINGSQDLTYNDRRETQKQIKKVLGIDERILLTSNIFSSKSLSFPEAKEADRKKLIYDVLDLNKYKKASDKAKDKIDEIEEQIEHKNQKLAFIQEGNRTIIYDIENAKGKSKTYKDTQKIKTEEIQKQINCLTYIDIEQKKKQVIELNKEYVKIDDDKLNKLIDLKLKVEGEITQIKQDLQIIKNNLFSVEDSICPILEEKCDILQNKKDETFKKYNPQYTDLQKQIQIKNEFLDRVTNKIEKIQDTITYNTNIQNKILEVEYHIERDIESNKTIDNKKIDLQKQIENIQQEENPYTEQIKVLEERLKEANAKIKELDKEINGLNEKIKYYSYWKKGYSQQGIPNLKSESFLESLELETNKILGDISDQLRVEIGGQDKLKSGEVREKVGYNVLHPEKKIKSYYSYSSGQKQRIRIADMFAMYYLLGKFNFMLMDEVLEMSLDSKGKSSILELLRSQSHQLDCLFVISHDKEVQNKFDNIIHIKENNGVSNIL